MLNLVTEVLQVSGSLQFQMSTKSTYLANAGRSPSCFLFPYLNTHTNTHAHFSSALGSQGRWCLSRDQLVQLSQARNSWLEYHSVSFFCPHCFSKCWDSFPPPRYNKESRKGGVFFFFRGDFLSASPHHTPPHLNYLSHGGPARWCSMLLLQAGCPPPSHVPTSSSFCSHQGYGCLSHTPSSAWLLSAPYGMIPCSKQGPCSSSAKASLKTFRSSLAGILTGL